MMPLQSIFSAILALLMVQTLISAVTSTPVTSSAVADSSSDHIRNTSLAWPSYLPGWGTITVFRDKLADEYDMGMLEQSDAWDAIPHVYNIHRPGNGVCHNPYSFPDTDAVRGMICLPNGDDYNSMAEDIMTHDLGVCERPNGCFCACVILCSSKKSPPTSYSCSGFIVLTKSSFQVLSYSGPFAVCPTCLSDQIVQKGFSFVADIFVALGCFGCKD